MKWLENLAFEAEVNGHRIVVDADESVGGNDLGPRPKPLMLLALAGCTGIDVVTIMKKLRVDFSGFRVIVGGDVTEEHPKHYEKMHIVYEVTGKNLQYDKIKRAVELSEEKYCGVSAVYKKAIPLSYEIRLVEEQ